MAILSQEPSGRALLLHIKAVPGAKRDEIVGALGDRLKVRVSQPPEGGKANGAIVALIAEALGIKPGDIEIVSGHGGPTKTLRIAGVSLGDAAARFHIAG